LFAVDTNILVYAVHAGADEHELCRALVEEWRADTLPSHPRVFSSPLTISQAWSFVSSLLAAPGLQLLVEGSRHADVAATTFADLPDLRGNLTHDAHIAILLREHGVRQIYTRDTDFHRFPFLEVVDPLRV